MPLYELFCLTRPTLLKTQLGEIIKRTAKGVLENDGVVTDIKYFGINALAKAVKSGNERFTDVRRPQSGRRQDCFVTGYDL